MDEWDRNHVRHIPAGQSVFQGSLRTVLVNALRLVSAEVNCYPG